MEWIGIALAVIVVLLITTRTGRRVAISQLWHSHSTSAQQWSEEARAAVERGIASGLDAKQLKERAHTWLLAERAVFRASRRLSYLNQSNAVSEAVDLANRDEEEHFADAQAMLDEGVWSFLRDRGYRPPLGGERTCPECGREVSMETECPGCGLGIVMNRDGRIVKTLSSAKLWGLLHGRQVPDTIDAFLKTWTKSVAADEMASLGNKTGSGELDQTRAAEERRMWLVVDWMVRTYAPTWLKVIPDLRPHAEAIQDLSPIVSREVADAAKPTLKAALDSIRSRRNALTHGPRPLNEPERKAWLYACGVTGSHPAFAAIRAVHSQRTSSDGLGVDTRRR